MSFENGWAALNMEMPDKVPRTEYSVTEHWSLIEKVTGISASGNCDEEVRIDAQRRFMKAWDYSFRWNVLINHEFLPGRKTSMGHAEYSEGGTDYDPEIGCPFKSVEDVLSFDPIEEYCPVDAKRMMGEFEAHYKRECEIYSDAVNMSGVYITMFSGLIDIFGWDMLLMAAGSDMDAFGKMTQRYEKWVTPFFEAYANSDIPVMMSHDDIVWTSGPVLQPSWYREFIFPAFKRLWAPVIESGKKLVYTSDGTYTMFFDDVVKAGAHALVMEPTSDMALFAEKYGKTHGFIGNADTRILLSGSKEDIRAEVKRCMDIGKDCPGFFMCVGNHIPANTPVENALYYNEVYEEMARR